MKYKLTVLNIPAFLFLLGCVIYTILRYPILSANEGWGVIGMIGLFIFGLVALVIDFIIQRLVKAKDNKIIINLIVLAGLVIAFFMGS